MTRTWLRLNNSDCAQQGYHNLSQWVDQIYSTAGCHRPISITVYVSTQIGCFKYCRPAGLCQDSRCPYPHLDMATNGCFPLPPPAYLNLWSGRFHSQCQGCFVQPIQGWASECPDVTNYKWQLNPVWHRMLYSCTHYPYGNSGHQRVNEWNVLQLLTCQCYTCFSSFSISAISFL